MPPSMQQRKRIREKQSGSAKRRKENEDRLLRMDEGTLIEPGMEDEFIQNQLAKEAQEIKDRPDLAEKVESGTKWAAGVPASKVTSGAVKAGGALMDALGGAKDAVVGKVKDLTADSLELEDLPKFDAPEREFDPTASGVAKRLAALPKSQQNLYGSVLSNLIGSQTPRSWMGLREVPGADKAIPRQSKDYGSLYDALDSNNSSETIEPAKTTPPIKETEKIQPVIEDETPIEDDSDASAESKAYWNELFDRYEAMESQPDEVEKAVEEIIADDPELMDQDIDRPVDEKEFAEFMENRPEFMMPASDPLADFDVYVDDEGKTRVRESMEKAASSKPTPQMGEGPATFSSFMANLFDPVSKAIEDLYTKSRLSNSQAEKYEIMDQIEDLQKLQGPERAERYSGPGATRRLGERRDKTSDRNVPQRILNQMRAAQMRK